MRRLLPLLVACSLPALSACSLLGGDVTGRKYVVFFGAASSALDAPARKIVAQVADVAASNPQYDLTVAGYAYSGTSPSAEEALAAARGEHVADALRAEGVAANRIRVRPRPNANENRSVAARRVEIDFGF